MIIWIAYNRTDNKQVLFDNEHAAKAYLVDMKCMYPNITWYLSFGPVNTEVNRLCEVPTTHIKPKFPGE